MQPVVILAVVGVAVSALGLGFLDNDIDMTDMVQQFGVGEETIISPVSQAYIDFQIGKTVGLINQGGQNIMVFKNIISECIVQVDKELVPQTKVICKLTDINSNVVIEGMTTIDLTVPTHALINVPIVFTGGGTPTNLVSNIHDVQLVIIGPSALVPTAPGP